jgi:hypothetical protein
MKKLKSNPSLFTIGFLLGVQDGTAERGQEWYFGTQFRRISMLKAFGIIALILCSAIDAQAQVCAGTPRPQVPINVTASMSFVAPGVTVSQLTNVGSNRFYYFDVPAFGKGQILSVNFAGGNFIVAAAEDGTKAQQISATAAGSQAFFSWDGSLVYYMKPVKGGTPGGQDIYGVLPFASGKCAELRLTNLDAKQIAPLPVWEVSSTSVDPSGGWDIAFSPDTLFHQVHVLVNGTSALLPTYTLQDPESAGTFHRLRINPKFRNIVMWKRNGTKGGTSANAEVWIVDLNQCVRQVCAAGTISNVIAKVKIPGGRVPAGGHIAWSPDGLSIAFSEIHISDYWLARNVVNANGTLNAAFTLQEIGPFGKPQVTADYCSFPRDWPASTLMACLAGPASKAHAKTLYLLSTDGKGTMKFLSATDAQVLTINGTPMMQFAQDDTHILFNSDKTGVPQVYEVSGFSYQVP